MTEDSKSWVDANYRRCLLETLTRCHYNLPGRIESAAHLVDCSLGIAGRASFLRRRHPGEQTREPESEYGLGHHDHPRLRAFDDRDTIGDAVERIPRDALDPRHWRTPCRVTEREPTTLARVRSVVEALWACLFTDLGLGPLKICRDLEPARRSASLASSGPLFAPRGADPLPRLDVDGYMAFAQLLGQSRFHVLGHAMGFFHTIRFH